MSDSLKKNMTSVVQLNQKIEELLQAEKTVKHARQDWENTFNSVPDYIALLDKQHTITRVNRAMAELLNVNPMAAVGQKCYVCMHNTSKPPDYCPHSCLMQDGQSIAWNLGAGMCKNGWMSPFRRFMTRMARGGFRACRA